MTEVVSYTEFEQAMKALGLTKVYDSCGHTVENHWRDHPRCYIRRDDQRWETKK